MNKYFFNFLEKKIGTKKKVNKENLCKNPPAISSLPNGPPNFRPEVSDLKPNMSTPLKNWKKISKQTKRTAKELLKKKYFI